MNEISTNQSYRFGEFRLDPARAGLFRGNDDLRLRRRTFEVLTYLVRDSGRLVLGETAGYFRERIFEPLQMTSTGFQVPPGRAERLTTNYT